MQFHYIPEPYESPYNNCLYCAIGNVLSWYGCTKQEIDLIFNGQLDFYYARQAGNPGLPFTFTEDFPVNFILDKYALDVRLRELLQPYGISAGWNESDKDTDNWAEICAFNEQAPIILFVDHYYLPYHEAYHKAHGAHFVTLLGNNGRDAYILDSVSQFKYEGPLTYECLSEARVLDTEISRIDNAWLTLGVKQESEPPRALNVVKTVLNRTVYCMLGREAEEHKFWGVAAIQVFVQDMARLTEAFDNYDSMLELDSRLARSFDNLFISFLRVAQQRKAFSEYLRDVAAALPAAAPRLEGISASYSGLHEQWLTVRNRFFLAHHKRNLMKLRASEQLFADILEKEKELIQNVEQAAQEL